MFVKKKKKKTFEIPLGESFSPRKDRETCGSMSNFEDMKSDLRESTELMR